jgi:hypothetical protein
VPRVAGGAFPDLGPRTRKGFPILFARNGELQETSAHTPICFLDIKSNQIKKQIVRERFTANIKFPSNLLRSVNTYARLPSKLDLCGHDHPGAKRTDQTSVERKCLFPTRTGSI